jgi:N-carbamoylputrescine amidase
MEHFKIGLVQMNAWKDDLQRNLATHARFAEQATTAGCRLVLFPELSLTAHYGDAAMVQFAQPADRGSIFDAMSNVVRQHQVVVGYGFCEEAHGTYYNSYALLSRDGIVGVQRKVHLSYDEYFHFRAGRAFEHFDLGFCRAAVLICYDSDIFESWRVAVLRGAEVVLLPHAMRYFYGGGAPSTDPAADLRQVYDKLPGHHGVYARANGVYAAFCNQVQHNGHSRHLGGAYLIGPAGDALARAEPTLDDTLLIADVAPGPLQELRRNPWYTVKLRRPEVYQELTRMI